MSWAPIPADLASLVQLLTDSSSGQSHVQAQVMQQLNSFNRVPDFPKYLAYIFTLSQESVQVRQLAGLMLKNNVKANEVEEYVKNCVLHAFADPLDAVRSTAGTIITTILEQHLDRWPQAIPKMLELVDSPNPAIAEASLSALEKICEDSADAISRGDPSVLQFLLQKCLEHFDDPSHKNRANALHCVRQFALIHADPLMDNIEAYVQALYRRTSDEAPEVRKALCQSLVLVLEVRPDVLFGELDNVVNFMLYCTQSPDLSVALEACEFWLAFAEQEMFRDPLHPHLRTIVPVLMKSMVYSEDEVATLGGDEDDAAVPDSQQDMKPRHHKARTHNQKTDAPVAPVNESDSDFDDEDDDEVYSEWTLRKCSAATIDILSTSFGDEMLPLLLPIVQEFMQSPDWKLREAAILALGAIGEGCGQGVSPHLPQLVPHLIATLSDSKPLVRSITCWTLGRYSRWIVRPDSSYASTEEQYQAHLQKYFQPMLQGILRMVLDNNKRVQEAGCSALATVEEEAGHELVHYLAPILQTLGVAFGKYQSKNMLILYDAVGTLADSVGRALAEPRYLELLMPPLIHKWQVTADDDRDLFSLFECMSSVSVALGSAFGSFAPVVWERSLRLIKNTLIQIDMYNRDPLNADFPDKDFIVVGLDLMSGVVQGLGQASQPLVVSGEPNALTLLLICMKDPSADVRQSAYAFLGDLAINVFAQILPLLHDVMGECVKQMEPVVDMTFVSAVNNATWSVGEICLKHGAAMEPFVPVLLERLIAILMKTDTPRTLLENSAICLARLGLGCPTLVAPHLEHFVEPWCRALGSIRDNPEKESAYLGMCKLVQTNPNGMFKHLALFCDAIAQWTHVPASLSPLFRDILTMYRNGMGDQWAHVLGSLPVPRQQKLRSLYGV